jgi:hypothetical protein
MRYQLFAVAIAVSILGCESKDKSPPRGETKASLVDLPTLSGDPLGFQRAQGRAPS